MLELRDNLIKAQERMKRYADKSRTERKFHKGDWVFPKFKPYRQISVANRSNLKLSPAVLWYLLDSIKNRRSGPSIKLTDRI